MTRSMGIISNLLASKAAVDVDVHLFFLKGGLETKSSDICKLRGEVPERLMPFIRYLQCENKYGKERN